MSKVLMSPSLKQLHNILETPAANDTDGLRSQLESCRTALRLQVSRSRQIVAAYKTKLREKEIELRNAEKRFDTRLASIIRALLTLEGNMKREQKNIKLQLVEKDNIIEEQHKIICSFIKPSSPPTKRPLSVIQERVENNNNNNNKYLNETKKPEKPPIPCKPILKNCIMKKDSQTKSMPELSYAQQRAKKAANDVCLLLAPSKVATSTTCHSHPTSDVPQHLQKIQENKLVSPHRVSRMVQRFDTHNKRSSSCGALPSLRLTEHHDSKQAVSDCESSNIENIPAELYSLSSDTSSEKYLTDSKQPVSDCESSNIENIPAELYSLSSDTSSEKYQNVDALRGNFVEFHLDSDQSDENEDDVISRKEGDGAEIIKQVANNKQTSYEGFLEATGLSTKSILTPSRLSSVTNNSHRSVLKPRDVKFRSKANRCFNTGTVKYWSGPYL